MASLSLSLYLCLVVQHHQLSSRTRWNASEQQRLNFLPAQLVTMAQNCFGRSQDAIVLLVRCAVSMNL